MTSYSLSQRSHEMAVRAAVGAKRSDIVRLVIGEGLVLGAAGISLGMVCALLLSRLMQSLLFGVTAADPARYFGVGLVLCAAAMLASWAPAARISRQSIVTALRLD